MQYPQDEATVEELFVCACCHNPIILVPTGYKSYEAYLASLQLYDKLGILCGYCVPHNKGVADTPPECLRVQILRFHERKNWIVGTGGEK